VPSLVLRPQAEGDLADIYRYISDQGSAATAIRHVRRIPNWCDQLLAFPEAGLRNDLRPGIRMPDV